MSITFVITVPPEEELLQEIQQELSLYSKVEVMPPTTLDIESIKLVVELVDNTVGIAANIASIITFILALRQQHKQVDTKGDIRIGRPNERGVPIQDVDEELLRDLLKLG
jgi:hypothetical protein